MKKILIGAICAVMTLGLVACGDSETVGTKELEPMKEHKIINVTNAEEYKQFYNEYIPKLKAVIESDGKLCFKSSIDGDISVQQRENNNNNNDGSVMLISFLEGEESVMFDVSSYDVEGYPVEEQNKKILQIVKEICGYDIDLKKLQKHLESSPIYEINDLATLHKGEKGELSFDAKIIKNTSGIKIKDCVPKLTKDQIEEYNILKNGKIDKIIKRYDKPKKSVDVFMGEDHNNTFDIELGSSIGDLTFDYEFIIVDTERLSVTNTMSIAKNKEDYASEEEHLDAELKGLFEEIYGDTKLYEEIKSNLLAIPSEKEDLSIIITPDTFGFTKVVLKNRQYGYDIEIEYDQPME